MWRSKRKFDQLVEQGRVALANTAELESGAGKMADLDSVRADLRDVIVKAMPMLQIVPMAAPLLIDVGCASLRLEAAAKSWVGALGAGTVLASAIGTVRQRAETSDFSIELERELGRIVGAHVDLALFAAAKACLPSFVGTLAELMIGPGYLARQIVQMDNEAVREAWDWSTGIALNGGLQPGQDELAERIASGEGWLSVRQRRSSDPQVVARVMTSWKERRETLAAKLPIRSSTGLTSDGDPAAAEWEMILGNIDFVGRQGPDEQFLVASAFGCVGPLAARNSDRELIYLISSPHEGIAVRFHGGRGYREVPESVELPRAGLEEIRRLRNGLAKVMAAERLDVAERSAALDQVRRQVGDRIAAPIRNAWPGMERISLIPVGEMRDLPMATAIVGDLNWAELNNLSVVPNAAAAYTSAVPAGAYERPAVVLGDPGSGLVHLPWIATEVREVAAVYGQTPDLLVEYASEVGEAAEVRDLQTAPPLTLSSAEHVLSRIEDAKLIHLACHGYAPPDAAPELLLYGRIPFSHLEQHRLASGSCVVLSACSVGRNNEQATLALLGFPAMLLSIGASAVVGSTWPVIDCRDTVDFMTSLHLKMKTMGPVEAFSAALASMREARVPSAIWAGFELYGAPLFEGTAP